MKLDFPRLPSIFRSKFPGRPLAIVLAVIVGLFLLLNYIVLPLYVQHGSTLPVPNAVGQTLDAARASLEGAGLQPIQADTRPDPDRPAGTVINQNPAPGSIVKQGRRVYLTVSGGEADVEVPSLRGRTVRDAKFALERNSLRLGGSSFQTSSTFPEGTIVDQNIAPGTSVQKGTQVGIVVSQGADTLQIVVPHVAGKSTTEAERELLAAGLKVGNITLQKNFDLLPNTVVDQFPRSGEMVHRGQAVDLFVVQSGRPSEEFKSPR